jgi:hypothetical protein
MICNFGACVSTDVRPYIVGPRCAEHSAPPVYVDPELTLEALRARAGTQFSYNRNDTSLNDERAIASGRRRSKPQDYRAARAAEEARKKARHA